ncbi:MAG: GntR family transcriptional regulator [Desulfotignum sp.]|nr:GntR family transcriptional regulator [Desulfotignum sp.]
MNDFIKETYSDKVANYIKTRILNGNLSPGDPIKETEIASQLSISRAPVREAMLILLREGLIEIHPQRGKKVTSLSAKQIKNSYFTGGVLEAAAVAQAIEHYTDKDMAELDEIVSKMKQVADNNGSVSDQAPLDKAFHGLLLSRIDNELIVELCRRTCQGISKFLLFRQWVKLFPAIKVYERHKKIVEALKTRDPQVIEVVIRNHYMESGERMSAFGTDVLKNETNSTCEQVIMD